MFKIITFLITLLVGLGFAMVTTESATVVKKDIVEIKDPINRGPHCDASGTFQERVTVSMKGIVGGRSDNLVKFLISNNGCEPVSYTGYSEDSPIHRIKSDGKEIVQFWCGTGMQEFELAPGGSLVVSIPASLVWNSGKPDSAYSVGFWFSRKEDARGFWSDEFELPKTYHP